MAEVGSAFVSLVPSARGFGKATEKQIGGDLDAAGKSSGKRFGNALVLSAGAVLGGAAVLTGFLKGSFDEAREAQKVGAQTAAVIKSTGGAAKITEDQVAGMAGRLSNFTGIDDEAIQSGENMLLTFTNIRNEVDGKFVGTFDAATAATLDMSVAMGTDMKTAALQVGKALNDPIKGLTSLGRAGVQFTAQQKKQVKEMVKVGDTAGAQKIILGELNKQFGGSAQAQATAADKARVAWDNFKEQIGTALLPVLDRFFTTMSDKVIPAVSGFVTGMQEGTGAGGTLVTTLTNLWAVISPIVNFIVNNQAAVGTFAGILLTVAAAVKIWTTAQILLNIALTANPIGIVVVALAGLAAGLVYAYKNSETFRRIVQAAMAKVVTAVQALGRVGRWLWNNVYQPVFQLIIKAVGKVLVYFGKMLQVIGKAPGFGWVGKLGDKLVGAGRNADGLSDKIRKIPDGKAKIDLDTSAATRSLNSWLAAANSHAVRVPVYRSGATPGGVAPRALGGPINPTKTYLVGERGPELFRSRTAGRIVPNHDLTNGSGGGRSAITITNWATGEGYMERIADGRVSAAQGMAGQRMRARA